MKSLLLFLTLGLGDPTPIGPPDLDVEQLPDGTSTLMLFHRGMPVGEAHYTIERRPDGSIELRESTVAPAVGADAQIVSVLGPGGVARSMRGSGRLFGSEFDVDLAFSKGRASGHSLAPRSIGAKGKLTVDEPIPAGVFERTAVFFLAPAFPLEDDAHLGLDWLHSYEGKVERITARVTGSEELVVPAGRHDTWTVELRGSRPEQRLWITKEAPRRIVKIDVLQTPWSYELVAPPPPPQTTVFLVRHGKAAKGGGDPGLSEDGRAWAERLAATLGDASLDQILSTPLLRAAETAEVVAEAEALGVELYEPTALPALARQLRDRTGRFLVVGHSNTTPALVRLLGGEPGPPIEETEHERLYTVTITREGAVTTNRLRCE